MKRISIAALGIVVGGTAGCIDMGLEGNIELAEAENRQTSALVAAVTARGEGGDDRFIVGGRLWVPSGLPLTMNASDLQAVGSADGRTVHARRWDQAPFDALFVQASVEDAAGTAAQATGEALWIELRPVLGRTGRVPDVTGGATEGEEAAAGGAAPGQPAGGHDGH